MVRPTKSLSVFFQVIAIVPRVCSHVTSCLERHIKVRSPSSVAPRNVKSSRIPVKVSSPEVFDLQATSKRLECLLSRRPVKFDLLI